MVSTKLDRSKFNSSVSVWWSGQVPVGMLGLFVVMLGGAWDIAWHIDIGRDTFWSPPHLVLYSGILLVLFSMALGAYQGWRMGRRDEEEHDGPGMSLPFGLRVNPGMFMAGVGALMSLSSAPIDELWHRTFGLDVTIWSPPHLQLIFGLALTALGLLAALASELNHDRPGRLRSSLQWGETDIRAWALHLLAAFFVLMLMGVLDEYHFDIPQYALAYYPILLAPITVGGLMVGVRAGGWRWSATLISLLAVGVEVVLMGELFIVGLSHVRLFFIALPVAGVALDLLWARQGQAYRPWSVAGIGALVSAIYLLLQLGLMGWIDQVGWFSYPIAILAGTLGALAGGRIGMALRPGVEPERPAGRAGQAAEEGKVILPALILLLASGPLVPLAHGSAPPDVQVRLADPNIVAGEPFEVELRIRPEEALAEVEAVRIALARAGNRLEPPLEAAQAPGVYRASVPVPTPGQWFLGVWLETAHGSLVDWVWLQVAREPGGPPLNQKSYDLELQAPLTLPPEEVPQGWLMAGKALVTIWIVALTVVSFAGLRRIERHGEALAGH